MKNEYILFDNYEDHYTYDDYVDYCEANEVDPRPEDHPEFYSYLRDRETEDFHDFLQNMQDGPLSIIPVVVFGSVGTWTGKHSIESVCYQHFAEALVHMLKDCDYYSIIQHRSEIKVIASHHDGTHNFKVHFLNDKGVEAWYKGLDVDYTSKHYQITLKHHVFGEKWD